ncbi:MAG TPA: N-acetylneuraminate synthase [Syntrophus sp. (in: bacteria)]|jgi:N,N'-diacetyllegionaminate synthase|nr:N-acetylneuraminate synthase [Syntrophus sp. (in: bacteria)]
MNHNKTFIIAEAGVNHNGSLDMALQLIDVAIAAGADAVKFQTFTAEEIIAVDAPKAGYQKETTGWDESQLEMVKKLELDETAHVRLQQHCRHKGIQFLSAPFDLESIDLLNRLGLELFKIPSGEITNLPYLRKLGALQKRLILSTGMANLGEIEAALDILAESGTPWENIVVLHCNTEYPTPFEDVNLRAMLTIRNAFPGISVGYSDHTPGIEVPVAAVAMGATVIEKHFTMDRNLPGPDHKASLEPDELKAMVQAIRNIEKALGDGLKRHSPSEVKNKAIARKSLVATQPIKTGELFSSDNITAKRPGTGISPMRWDEVLGQAAQKDYKKDDLI